MYSVINIDIVSSRKIKKREELQEKLKMFFKIANEKYKNILVAPITFTLGDEWQIVLSVPQKSYDVFKYFQSYLLKNKIDIYCGIGIGRISTKLSKDTREMDGEAFINAREALNIAKKIKGFYGQDIKSKYNKVFFKGLEIPTDFYNEFILDEIAVTTEDTDVVTLNQVINNLIENNETIENKFTDKQREFIELYEEHGSYNNMIDINSNLSKSNISQRLNSCSYFLTVYNRKMIRSLFKTYLQVLERSNNVF